MRICLITAFPPSRHHLSEYGFQLADQLKKYNVDFVILGDEYAPYEGELDGYRVRRCWGFDQSGSGPRILQAIREIKPDVVWFNLVYSTFGANPLKAFAGLCLPALSRACGYRTHVTLHHLMDHVDLRHADVRYPRLYRAGGTVATRLLLRAHSVSVLAERYRGALARQYGARHIAVRPHGTLGTPHPPQPWLRPHNEFRMLAFGKWGRYKRLEPLLDAMPAVLAQVPQAKLLIAGCDHPNRPGYLRGLAEQAGPQNWLQWLGYLEEDRLAEVFQSSHVAVMPYLSSGGPSGVAHLACRFGLPIVSAAIDDLVQMADEEGFAMDTYDPCDAADLAGKLVALACDPVRQRHMGEQNYRAALNATMPKVVASYLAEFARLSGESLQLSEVGAEGEVEAA